MLIEPVILNYLKSKLNMASVYMEVPETAPKKFVTIELIDRDKTNHISAVTVELMSYADTLANAAKLDESVRSAMEEITELDEIISSSCGGGNNATDTKSKAYRYRSIYNLYL